jgi:hypothetical protein
MSEPVKDPSRRVMYVTMGTSLFHSATWEATDEVCEKVPGYREWTEGDCKTSPDRRQMHPLYASIRDGMQAALNARNAEWWAAWLPKDFRNEEPSPGSFLRYSAELTTILSLSETRPHGSTLSDFLKGYDQARIVHDDRTSDGEKNLPYVAAVHLAYYLNLLAAQADFATCVPLTGLSSSDPQEVLEGLGRLADDIEEARERFQRFDVIASGGYKLYGPVLADLRSTENISIRLIYLHEGGRGLFVMPHESERKPGKVLKVNVDAYS